MFEIEIAECKGAKEVLKSQLDESMEHLEEFWNTLDGRVIANDGETLKAMWRREVRYVFGGDC